MQHFKDPQLRGGSAPVDSFNRKGAFLQSFNRGDQFLFRFNFRSDAEDTGFWSVLLLDYD